MNYYLTVTYFLSVKYLGVSNLKMFKIRLHEIIFFQKEF